MALTDRIVRAFGGTPASALPTVIDQVLSRDREMRGAEQRAFASTLSDAMVRTLQEQLQSAGLGRRVNGSFSTHSIVYAAISRAMTNVARVPFKLAKPDADGNPGEVVAKHGLLDRLKRPHPQLYPTFGQMVETHVGSLLAGGNTWTQADPVVDSKTRIPLTFRALTSAHVAPLIDPATWNLLAWELRWGARPLWVDPATLDQCKLANPDSGPQLLGLGPLQAAQQAVNGDFAMQRYEEAFFVNGGALSLLLKYRGVGPEQSRQPLKPDDLRAARLAFEDAYAGSTKMRKVGAINLDWDLQDLGVTQRDMQFVEGRTWGLREIAMCFKVPAVLLNDQEKSALSGEQITAAEAQEARQVTVPLCTLLSAYYQQIFVDRYAPGHLGYFDVDEIEVLKGDFDKKVDNYCKLVSVGQVPARDAAALCDLGVDLDALPDVALVSFGLAPVTDVLEGGRRDALAIDVTPKPVPPGGAADADADEADEPEQLPPPNERRVVVVDSPRTRARRAAQEREGLRFARWRAVLASFRPLERRYRSAVRGYVFDLRAEVLANLTAALQATRAAGDDPRRALFDEAAANATLRTLSRPYFEESIRIGAEGVAELLDSDPFGLDAPGMRAFLQVKEIKVVGINETIREALRTTLGDGLDAGETLTGLADRVRSVFNASATRARTIARTEIGSSVSGSRFLEMHGQGVDRHRWLSSRDPHVRDTHQHVDGEEVAVGEPFSNGLLYVMDVNGPPEETINCFLPGTAVSGRFLAGLKSLYAGPAREIVTARGHRLTVTANHPVLTPDGWLPARALRKGQQLFTDARHVGDRMLRNPDHQDAPASVEDVFHAIAANGRRATRMVRALDLHGDAQRVVGQVEVVALDGALLPEAEPLGLAVGSDLILPASDTQEAALHRGGSRDLARQRIASPAARLPRTSELALDHAGRVLHGAPLRKLSFGLAAAMNPALAKPAVDDVTRHVQFARELVDGSAGLVAPDYVVDVRDFDFCGHVYDLQTDTGWMLAEGIVSSNCRCVDEPAS